MCYVLDGGELPADVCGYCHDESMFLMTRNSDESMTSISRVPVTTGSSGAAFYGV